MPMPTDQLYCLDRDAPEPNVPSDLTNPYVFLVGSPRSGTTMLKRMVNAHPMITISRETHWIPRFFEKCKGVDMQGQVKPTIVKRLFEHKRFPQMKMSPEVLGEIVATNSELSYAELVSKIFDNYARRKKKPLAGDKTPNYVRRLDTLWKLWPQTRVLHIIRDGRNVWLSMRNWRMTHRAAGAFGTWQESPVLTTALWWKAMVGIGSETGRQKKDNLYAEISYEYLVGNPIQGCRRIAAFLDLEYEESMPNYFEGKTHHQAGASANATWLPPTAGLRDWRTTMSREEIQLFEGAAGDLLSQFGYELLSNSLSEIQARQLIRIKQQFTEEALARGWRLPQCW